MGSIEVGLEKWVTSTDGSERAPKRIQGGEGWKHSETGVGTGFRRFLMDPVCL